MIVRLEDTPDGRVKISVADSGSENELSLEIATVYEVYLDDRRKKKVIWEEEQKKIARRNTLRSREVKADRTEMFRGGTYRPIENVTDSL
jgi:hypothetical protein